jgi:hypothetical protein
VFVLKFDWKSLQSRTVFPHFHLRSASGSVPVNSYVIGEEFIRFGRKFIKTRRKFIPLASLFLLSALAGDFLQGACLNQAFSPNLPRGTALLFGARHWLDNQRSASTRRISLH